MLRKRVTYTDFDGNERTEDFYFNLTEAEITEMQLSTEGGMEEYLQKIINSKDQKQLIDIFKKIILKAYGEKSPDGRLFMKSPKVTEAFQQTQAFSDIYMELVLDDKKASEFINDILPDTKKLADRINETVSKDKENKNK